MRTSKRGRTSRRWIVALVLLGIAACGGGSDPPTFVQQRLPAFMLGTSQGGLPLVSYAEAMGADWMRTHATWRTLEPVLDDAYLTVADVDADPDLIRQFSERANWSYPDDFIAAVQAAGMQPYTILGHGYKSTLPTYQGQRVTPDLIGKEHYLGHQYLVARAIVERYDGDGVRDAPGGQVVKWWQLENEINQAFLTALWGWREPAFGAAQGSAWQDWDFVTALVQTLARAVEMEDPEAWTFVNFHTDIPASFNQLFGHPSWEASIAQWLPHIDVVGLDAYPNYYEADPVKGTVLGDRVRRAAEQAQGKPIIIVETGYPSGPAERGFTEAKQALYIEQAFTSAVEAGAQGFMLFGVKTADTHTTEITQHDLDEIANLADLYESGNTLALLAYANENQQYIEDHLVDVLQTVEPYWGLVRPDETRKPGWHVYAGLEPSSP